MAAISLVNIGRILVGLLFRGYELIRPTYTFRGWQMFYRIVFYWEIRQIQEALAKKQQAEQERQQRVAQQKAAAEQKRQAALANNKEARQKAALAKARAEQKKQEALMKKKHKKVKK